MIEKQHTQEPVAFITYKGHLLHASDPRVAEYSNPEPLYTAPPDAAARIAELEKQRDMLLVELEKTREEMACANFNSAAERIDNAITRMRGGAA